MSVAVEGDGPTLLVLGHGAGAGMDSPFMSSIAQDLSSDTITVARFNFLYIEANKKAPDRAPVLEQTFSAVVDHLRAVTAPERVVLGGKSMGGRIASHLVAAGTPAEGLVFFGYPLHPPGRPDRLRTDHLASITTPMLFVEGTRDPLCPLDTLRKVTKDLPGPVEIAVIEDGDHSLKVRRSSGRTTEEAMAEVTTRVGAWLRSLGGP